MAVSSPDHQNGWPDVAMAAIDFAKEDPVNFLLVTGGVVAIVVVTAYIVRLLVPLKILTASNEFRHLRAAAQKKLAEQAKKHPSGG